MNRNRGRPWEREREEVIEPHTMSKETFENTATSLTQKIEAYRKAIAYYVVSMGYEPQSWPETLEIALNLVAGAKRRQRG